MTTRPAVSIIVPFFNSERYIKSCIQSLVNQTDVEGGYEIILVNNGSRDRSAAILAEYEELRVLNEATTGAYAARNAGIANAIAPLLAFTDADCTVNRNWLRSIQEGMKDPSTAILVGSCHYPGHASLSLRLLGAYENAKAEYVITHCAPRQQFAYANNMAVRAWVFAELGPFRQWQRAADTELIHRLASERPDGRVAYHDTMRITHLEFLSARARARRLSLYAQTNSKISTFAELGTTHRLGIVWHLIRRSCGR